ncbi:MAG: hypothetical protein ABUL72_07310 [Armatimonadota bacterium]
MKLVAVIVLALALCTGVFASGTHKKSSKPKTPKVKKDKAVSSAGAYQGAVDKKSHKGGHYKSSAGGGKYTKRKP